VSPQLLPSSRHARTVSAITVVAVVLMTQLACAGAATPRLHSTQSVMSAFGRAGIALHVVSRITKPGPLHNVTLIDMQRAEAARFGFDAGAYVFPTAPRARLFLRLLGDVHRGTGGFARLVGNVLVLIAPWPSYGAGGAALRDVPKSVVRALVRLQAG
jgi:hypothetical protein